MIDKQSKKPEGIGRLIRRDGGAFVDGAYKNGKEHGFGRGIWEDGNHVIGQFDFNLNFTSISIISLMTINNFYLQKKS
jgi:hypothetical protein